MSSAPRQAAPPPHDLALAQPHEETIGRILAVCRRLAAIGREAERTGKTTAVPRGASLWRMPQGAATGEVDHHYAWLSKHAATLDTSVADRVVERADAEGLLGPLHRLRARHEFDMELLAARSILADRDPRKALLGMMEDEAGWALDADLITGLDGRQCVAFIGAGPLPLSGLLIAARLDLRVVGVERAPAAVRTARRLCALVPEATVEIVEADAVALDRLSHVDAVVVAVLAGVDGTVVGETDRSRVLAGLRSAVCVGTRLLMREPHGLGRLNHPALAPSALAALSPRRCMAPRPPAASYRADMLIATL